MKRVKLVVAYDGTDYCGWQIQPNGITIEEVLNKALSDLLREPVAVIGASRTDSGVHAEGNVAVFDTQSRMPADKISFALNQRLPADIRVLRSEEVPADWHPRKQNCKKTYVYRILNRKTAMPTLRLYSHFCYVPLDVELMQKAAACLVGEHDFKSFCSLHGQAEETVRTVYSLDVSRSEDDMITIRVSGSGFLYNMVRIIAGTLMKAGMGAYPPEHVEEILEARDRRVAGPKMSAAGLTLVSLEYETCLTPILEAENRQWRYQLIQTEIPYKKKAYLVIHRCVGEDYDRLVTRLVHQAVRNGAREVFVCDKEQPERIIPGKAYGYYVFGAPYGMWWMERPVGADKAPGAAGEGGGVGRLCGPVSLEKNPSEPVSQGRIFLERLTPDGQEEFCRLFNETFFEVPNGATLDSAELAKRLKRPEEAIFFIMYDNAPAGVVMFIRQERKLEIDSIGILAGFRRRGIAGSVIELAEQMARDEGLTHLRLLAADNNDAAYRLYGELGFRPVGLRSRWYPADAAGYPGPKVENSEKTAEKP